MHLLRRLRGRPAGRRLPQVRRRFRPSTDPAGPDAAQAPGLDRAGAFLQARLPGSMSLTIRDARPGDAALVLRFVQELADYEREPDAVVATAGQLDQGLFGPNPRGLCASAEGDAEPVGMALWFYTFSTWRGRHGIYLEDFYVTPAAGGRGAGKAL